MKTRRRSINTIVICWFLAMSGILLGVILHYFNQPLEGAAVAVLGFAPLFYFLDRRLFKGFLIGPLIFSYLFHAFGYALGPLWQIYVIHRLDPILQGFVPAQWGGVLGLTTLALTFPVFFRFGQKYLGPRNPQTTDVEPQASWMGYSIVLLIAAGSTILLGFFSGVANRLAGDLISIPLASLVSAFANVSFVAFFFLGYLAVRNRGVWWVIWGVTYLLFAIFYFLDGGRGAPVYAAIFSAIGWVWAGFSVRRVILWGLVALVVFVPFVGVVELYRDDYANLPDVVSLDMRISGLSQAVEQFGSQNTGSVAKATEAFARALTARTVDRIFLLTPQYIPFAGMDGINKVYYAFIPTIIKADRPVLLDGNDLAILFGAANPMTTGAYTPTVGDGYRRGGWFGIVLLYAFTALIYAVIAAVCWERRGHRVWMAMFVFLTFQSPGMWSTTLLSNFYFLLWLVPRNLIVFWLLRWVQTFFQIVEPGRSANSVKSVKASPTVKNFLDELP